MWRNWNRPSLRSISVSFPFFRFTLFAMLTFVMFFRRSTPRTWTTHIHFFCFSFSSRCDNNSEQSNCTQLPSTIYSIKVKWKLSTSSKYTYCFRKNSAQTILSSAEFNGSHSFYIFSLLLLRISTDILLSNNLVAIELNLFFNGW